MSMKTTTGDVRSILADALRRANRGELSAVDGKNLIGLANQITNSIAVEIKHQNINRALGGKCEVLGSLVVDK